MKNRPSRIMNETNCIALGERWATRSRCAELRRGRVVAKGGSQTESCFIIHGGTYGMAALRPYKPTVINNRSRPEAQVLKEGRRPLRECPDLA